MNETYNKKTSCLIGMTISIFLYINSISAEVRTKVSSTVNQKHHTYLVPKNNAIALQNILKKIKNGDTIILSGGRYIGHFFINKSILLTAKHSATLTSNFEGTILKINAPNVKVHRLTFQNSGNWLQNKDSCIFVSKKSDHVIISNNTFNRCEFAIWANGIQHGLIVNNTINGNTQAMLSNRGNDIQIWLNTGTVIKNNMISKGRDGIYISNSKKTHVMNNTMREVRFGIHFMYNQNCSLSDNTVINSTLGLALMYSNNLLVKANIVKNNHSHGYLLRQVNSSKLLNNLAKGNADGIFLGGSYFNLMKGNEFIENTYGLIITSGSKSNIVYDNNFINNKLQVKYLNLITLKWGYKGRGNYWSNYQGFDLNHDGVGNKPYYVTNLAQWLSYSFPILKVIFDSPAMGVLQKIENEFPVLRRAALIDKYPLMRKVRHVR